MLEEVRDTTTMGLKLSDDSRNDRGFPRTRIGCQKKHVVCQTVVDPSPNPVTNVQQRIPIDQLPDM